MTHITLTTKFSFVAIGLLCLSLCACHNNSGLTIESSKTDLGWGYKKKAEGRVIINQPFIPVVAKRMGFPTEEIAKKTASLVVDKLIKNQHPAISPDDLKKVGFTLYDSAGYTFIK